MTFTEMFSLAAADDAATLLQRFLSEGGDVNLRDADVGCTPLHCACEHRNHPLIEALAAAGADLDAAVPDTGWTPLHHAVDVDVDVFQRALDDRPFVPENCFPTARILLRLGADPTCRNWEGETPRDMAAGYGPEVLFWYDRLTSRPPTRYAGAAR